MLPDFSWTELLVIAIVLIVVVGPKDLPRLIRGFSKTMKNVRKMAGDFRKQFDDALSDAEMDELKNLASDVKSMDPRNSIKEALNPLNKVGQEIGDELKGIAKSVDDDTLPEPKIAPPEKTLTPDDHYPQLAKMRKEREAAEAAQAAEIPKTVSAAKKKAPAKRKTVSKQTDVAKDAATAKAKAAPKKTTRRKTPAKVEAKPEISAAAPAPKKPARKPASKKPAAASKPAPRKAATKAEAKS